MEKLMERYLLVHKYRGAINIASMRIFDTFEQTRDYIAENLIRPNDRMNWITLASHFVYLVNDREEAKLLNRRELIALGLRS